MGKRLTRHATLSKPLLRCVILRHKENPNMKPLQSQNEVVAGRCPLYSHGDTLVVSHTRKRRLLVVVCSLLASFEHRSLFRKLQRDGRDEMSRQTRHRCSSHLSIAWDLTMGTKFRSCRRRHAPGRRDNFGVSNNISSSSRATR